MGSPRGASPIDAGPRPRRPDKGGAAWPLPARNGRRPPLAARGAAGDDLLGPLPPSGAGPALPLPDRLAIAYLAAPLAVWLLGWFKPWAGMAATALLVAGLWRAMSGPWRPSKPSRTVWVLALASAAIVLASPAAGLLLVERDWEAHRAIFLELSAGDWPTRLDGHLQAEPLLLRYYLGWHMVPAAVARLAGVASLNWTAPLWTWCGTALVAVLFAGRRPTARSALLALGVLFLFGGLDVADVFSMRLLEWIGQVPPPATLLEYQPHLETFRVTPQHFVPAALGSLLLIRLRENPRFLAVAGIVLAACSFWSAFVAAGLAPLALAAAVAGGRLRAARDWRNVLVGLPLGGLVALYLAGGELDFTRAWLWNLWDDPWHMAVRLAVLYATEFLVLAFLVAQVRPPARRDPLLLVAVAALAFAPLYHYGLPNFSEWSARFAVPSLIVLACHVAAAVASRLPETAEAPARKGAWRALVAFLVVGAGPVARDLADARAGPFAYERTGESLLADVEWRFVRQRVAPNPPRALTALLRDRREDSVDAPVPLAQSKYDVHLEGDGRLVYAKKDCDWESEHGSWLFLDVRHERRENEPAPRMRRPPWDEWLVRDGEVGRRRMLLPLKRVRHYAEDRGCMAVARFSRSGATSIRTGQIAPGGRLVWEVERALEEEDSRPAGPRPFSRP